MNLKKLIKEAVFRFYGNKEANQIAAEATKGLAPMDWDALYNQMYGVPGEDEIKAPNEEHVRMYDKDIKELQAMACDFRKGISVLKTKLYADKSEIEVHLSGKLEEIHGYSCVKYNPEILTTL